MDSENTRILKAKIPLFRYLIPFPVFIVLLSFLAVTFSDKSFPMKILGILFSIFFVPAFILSIISLLPDRNFLALNSKGIEIKGTLFSEFYYWNEIDIFEKFYLSGGIIGRGSGYRCAFYLKDPSKIPSWKRSIGVDVLLGCEVYGNLKPHELVQLLNQWKDRYAPSPE